MKQKFQGDLADDIGRAFTLEWLNISDKNSDGAGNLRREVLFGILDSWTLKRIKTICNSVALALQGRFDGKFSLEGDAISFTVSYDA